MKHLAESSPQPPAVPPSPSSTSPGGRPVLRIVGYLFLGLAFLLLFYGAVAYFGWQAGEADRVAAVREEQQATISRQLELAQADIDSGSFQLALRRLDYVLSNDPSHAEAQALQQAAQNGLALRLTPTVTPSPAPSPTPTAEPTATTPADTTAAAQAAFAEAETLIENSQWRAAVEALEAFQLAFPDFRRRDTDEMLYDAYVNYGLSLTRGSEIERGVFYLNQAAGLGDLSEEVLGEIFWAEQYLEGIVFYGIDWEAYLSYFRPLCEFAPLYQNSCGQLADGLVSYAQLKEGQLDYCPAEALYREALRTGEISRSDIETALTTATDLCLAATPTPEIDLTATAAAENGEFAVTPTPDVNGSTNNSFGGSAFPLFGSPTPAP